MKRAQPGHVTGVLKPRPDHDVVGNMKHDASTLGGNSGSPVVDLATGDVIGLHCGGVYMLENYAVPTWELARDTRVYKSGIEFTGTPAAEDPMVLGHMGSERGAASAVRRASRARCASHV